MRKMAFILFFLLALTGGEKVCANILKDTVTPKITRVNLKAEIIQNLFGCFVDGKFFSLVIFCNEYVDYGYQEKDSTMVKSVVTDYKAMDNLENTLRGVNYPRFKIMSGENVYLETVLVVRIYFSALTDDSYADIYFILDHNSAIKSIYLF
jgi:hypothetical protein